MKITDKLESLLEPAGYTTSITLTTSPMWLNIVSILQATGFLMGVLVGLATFYLTVLKIKKLKKESRDV